VDLFVYADLDRAGAGVDYEHRLTPSMSAFAQGWVGAARTDSWKLDAGTEAGLRWSW
jgi:hypothetical protein